ncbi:hypothetical protein HKX48_004468, partial [Thoreauomyces humboldtii]
MRSPSNSSSRLLLFICLAILLVLPALVDAQHPYQRRAKGGKTGKGSKGGKGTKGGKGGKGGQGQGGQAAETTTTAEASGETATTTTEAAAAATATNPPPFAQDAFCASSNLESSDGTQIKTGACSSTPMGQIPTTSNMVSSLITSPDNGATIDASKDMTVVTDYRGLTTGFFSDATLAYYVIPQTLAADGTIQGHAHITVQNLADANSAPDPQTFAFFKGLNDVATGGRTLAVTVPAGSLTSDGTYRICSMSGSNSHQALIMPVAQRGAQDDCIRVTVTNSGGGKNKRDADPTPT